MTFGFGLQVLKIPAQTRERTMIKPITYSSLQSNKKPPMPKLPPSANKLHREDFVEVIDQGQGRLGFKEMPNIKLAKLPKLPQISKALETDKPKAYSQNDISTRSRRSTKNKLEKLSLTGKREKNTESFQSMYGAGNDTKREPDTLMKVQELEDPVDREVKPIEIKSLNIVQKKLTYNRDSWFDLKDVRGPPRRESALGSYLSKALLEVSSNVSNGAMTQGVSPRDNLGLEIKGQRRDQIKEKVVIDRRGKVRKDSEASREMMPVQEQGTGEEQQYKSEGRIMESGKTMEVKKVLKRPSSKLNKEKERKKKEAVVLKKEKEEEDDSKIEEYRFEGQSDDDLSLDEYLKAKKENQENNETEEVEYDFLSKQEL